MSVFPQQFGSCLLVKQRLPQLDVQLFLQQGLLEAKPQLNLHEQSNMQIIYSKTSGFDSYGHQLSVQSVALDRYGSLYVGSSKRQDT